MRSNYLEATLKKSVLAAIILLLTVGISSAQSVTLTATRQTTTLPDGNIVPMWGWICGTGTAAAAGGATCSAMNGLAQTTVIVGTTTTTPWQPPLITVPVGSALTINLTNSLPVETSLTIVGQQGGGLGAPVRESGPRAHPAQSQTTWPIQGGATFTPPAQGARVRSFVPEAAAGGTQTYTWAAYNATTGQGLKPGTYLIETGTYPSIQGPMGLYGVLVVYTPAAAGGTAFGPGTAYSSTVAPIYSIHYDAAVPLLLSEIDPVQNAAADAVVCPPTGTTTPCTPATPSAAVETATWNPACAAAHTCYPPAVDYTPLYYLVNGVSFSKDALAASAIQVPATASTGNVLLRFVNAGLRIHSPSVARLNMALIAEDGNVLPDIVLGAAKTPPNLNVRVQNNVFLPAGKTYDVMINPANNGSATAAPTAFTAANYQLFDRELSLSGNASGHDTGMQAILQVGGGTALASALAAANNDLYYCAPGVTLLVSDPGRGLIANDVNVYGVRLTGNPANNTLTPFGGGSLTLNPDGTFTYTQPATNASCGGSFTYYVNGNTAVTAAVTISPSPTLAAKPTANADSYTSNISSLLRVAAPGVLGNDTDPNNYPLCAAPSGSTACPATPQTITAGGVTVSLKPDGSFTAKLATPPTSGTSVVSFQYLAVNSEKQVSSPTTVTLTFQAGSGLQVIVQDAQNPSMKLTDYKWIIEQDRTFHINPACQQNGAGGTKPATCPAGVPPTLGTNFHTSYMPVVAVGCTGPQSCEQAQTVFDPTTKSHVPAVCDGGVCVPATGAAYLPTSLPSQVNLPTTDANGNPVYYYISVLPGDAANSFNSGNTSPPDSTCFAAGSCGHTMGGAPISPACTSSGTTSTCTLPTSVTVNVEPNPLPTSTVTVFVFQDDFPLNGEPDTGGGADAFPTQEVGLEDFQVILWDDAGGSGDATGQMTYDMFNEPLTNALNGTIDPQTGLDACPISNISGQNVGTLGPGGEIPVGVIIVCPKFESDGVTLSPLVGQAVIKNLMPGRFGVIVHPGAAREARGEEWLQTNTLDGTHALDSFVKMAEPAYFQEYGPGGYHVFMGMANPAIINARLKAICTASATNPTPPPCHNTVKGQVTNLHQGRPPSEQLFSSGVFAQGNTNNYAPLNYTTCYAALGDSDASTFAFTKCDANGNFTFTGIPDGSWGLVIFDQWLDLIVDGSSKGVNVKGGQTLNLNYSAFTWQTHLWSNTFMDVNGNGIQDPGEPGLAQIPNRVRMRNGKFNNSSLTDINGQVRFDETFPLFNWYVTETDNTRFKSTGVHVVNDAGGQVDGPASGGFATAGNGNGGPYQGLLNSKETFSVPANLRIPGAVYCGAGDAACTHTNLGTNPTGGGPGGSTGRVDPGSVISEGWQGGVSQFNVVEWGKKPYVTNENGGIRGHVVYSSTRPFDDPNQLFQNLWEPLVPGVTVNLYAEGTGPDGTQTLTLVDTTKTSSWDDWAQGFRAAGVPNMNCPGQDPADPFFSYTLAGTRNYLSSTLALPNNSQYKCYDGYHNLNQVQPAPYDGLYQFPSAAYIAAHPLTAAQKAAGQTLVSLPPGKYVVEAVTPPNYEIVKEEDKNILIGDNFIAPVTQQFAAISNIFIVPDQASINAYNQAYGTGGGATNPTTDLGRTNIGGFGPGGLIVMPAPCVGQLRVVPDFMSISPESGEVAPFAGASRRLCDRKEVTLEDQMQAQTDFFVWTKTPAASHFAGFITDDFSSEFDPASPAFGEKFAVPNSPISIKDYNGVETSRVYSDQWGIFNGLVYSTWQVNPPNPTGYAPNMMVACMNDPGPVLDTRPGSPTQGQMITDPMYNPNYSDFCYEWPFMPADTAYMDTPVVPTTAFADGYNPPDCSYPDATPAILRVDGDGPGPWVSGPGHKLTITALGNQLVPNHSYSGPAASTAPYNQKFVTRHYGFGTGQGSVTIGGANQGVTSWSDTTLTVNVGGNVPLCARQQVGYSGARCGELVITTANGKTSIDTVTVTVGGKAPTVVNGENASNTAIQQAIDNASPGDLIIINGSFAPSATAPRGTTCAGVTTATATCVATPGTYSEMLQMWKPVRLQGVGAASAVVNANTHPAGKLDPWRRRINCLFGLALDGGYVSATHPYDPTNTFSCTSAMQGKVDPIPMEPVVGWDATLNGNIAELLQEPSLMGAYEGAAITVLAKGLENNNTANCNATSNANCIPLNGLTGTAPNNGYNNGLGDCNTKSAFYTTNFLCNPARIDGLSFTNSSQGGGGIFLHGWGHYVEVANNRVYANGGTLGGGIIVGQGETPPASFDSTGLTELPYLLNHDVFIHHNSITGNASYGDELNSNTPAVAGGAVFCDGSDYYRFQYNWVCGNLSGGDGGGVAHFGFIYNGTIDHNWIVFNQSTNPTLPTHGGGLIVGGAATDGTVCEAALVDTECPPALADGAGPNTTVSNNVILGNTAEGGSGGGLRLQHVNGTEVQRNPNNSDAWYQVNVTNNVIVNNVAGWTGGGVSLHNAVKVNFIQNTVASNDTTSSAGVLFDAGGASFASAPPPGCDPTITPPPPACTNTAITQSVPLPAGLETEKHDANLLAAFTVPTVNCGLGHAGCTKFSNPILVGDIFWQNRTFHITTGAIPTTPSLQTTVQLVPSLTQSTTGACPGGASYWDIGVYGDTSPTNHGSGFTLTPVASILTSSSGYPLSSSANPGFVHQYCNGSRVPPEIAPLLCSGPNGNANAPGCIQPGTVGVSMTVPPGVPDINQFYPAFTLAPAATVDEGNNWINMFYGPLSYANSTLTTTPGAGQTPLGNYNHTGPIGAAPYSVNPQ